MLSVWLKTHFTKIEDASSVLSRNTLQTLDMFVTETLIKPTFSLGYLNGDPYLHYMLFFICFFFL